MQPQNSVGGKYKPQWLLVDDDEDDMLIFEQAINDLKIDCNLHYVNNGDNMFRVLDYISPDLLFLDLHLPGKSGFSCLKMLRHQRIYDRLPIIIYSNSNKPSFINECYTAKANYYIIKPLTVQKICYAVNKVCTTNWEVDRYPSKENFLIAVEPESQPIIF